MKYVIVFFGLIIIILRTLGIEIDIISIGLFVFISIILLIKDYNTLKKIKGFGIEFEFDRKLKELVEETDQLEDNLEKRQKQEQGLSGIPELKKATNNEKSIKQDTSLKKDSLDYKIETDNPKIALINLAIELEKELRDIIGKHIDEIPKHPISATKMMELLVNELNLDRQYLIVFKDFWRLRNQVLHEPLEKIDEDLILSLTNTGIKILKIIRTIDNNLSKGIKIMALT
ncbi:MAG: hypothetical protein K8R58_14275 [Bacteroidales bacterium]|nr:hypothetical protein [Bacteroidales bacterium]